MNELDVKEIMIKPNTLYNCGKRGKSLIRDRYLFIKDKEIRILRGLFEGYHIFYPYNGANYIIGQTSVSLSKFYFEEVNIYSLLTHPDEEFRKFATGEWSLNDLMNS